MQSPQRKYAEARGQEFLFSLGEGIRTERVLPVPGSLVMRTLGLSRINWLLRLSAQTVLA